MFGSSKLQQTAILAFILVVAGTQGIANTWSTSADWSSASNPSGAWTYGYLPSLTGLFAAYGVTSQNAEGAIQAWSSEGDGTAHGCAIKNVSSSLVTIGGMSWSPGQTSVHPGVLQPSLGTFRWTAPVTNMVQVTFAFSGIDATGATTDVHVLKNGVSLFDGEVDGFAGNPSILAFGSSPVTSETILLTVSSNDKLDFAVGSGSNGPSCDSTGLDVTITEVACATVTGTARAADIPGQPALAGATVRTEDGSFSTLTDGQGDYSLLLPAGTYTIQAVKQGYVTAYTQLVLIDGQSITACFDLATVPTVPIGRLGEIRGFPDGSCIALNQPAVATLSSGALPDGSYYLEDPDRVCGVRIIPPAGAGQVSVGDRITLTGYVGTDANGERLLNAVTIDSKFPGQVLTPLGSVNRRIPLIRGLLVRAWGRVTYAADDSSYIYIDDGARLQDGSGLTGLRILTDTVMAAADGDWVAVTGVSCLSRDGSLVVPAIRATTDVDIISSVGAPSVMPSPEEMVNAQAWAASHLSSQASELPFTFTYDGRPSSELLASWGVQCDVAQLDDQRRQRTLISTDPVTGLTVRCVAIEYLNYPTVEWTLTFTNTGQSDTPVLSDITAIDTMLSRGASGEFILHYNNGDNCSPSSFQPHDDPLPPGSAKQFAAAGGRPTNGTFPYYNIEWPGQGAIVVLGWAGQWSASFTRDSSTGLQIQGGQELTHLRLHPGETVRSPLAVVQFYMGGRVRAQNIWRRWMLAHNVPKQGGNAPAPMLIMCDGGFFPGLLTSEAGEKEFIDAYVANGITPDYWWIDAGWYPTPDGWWTVGTWEPDPARYPNGLLAVSDYVHARDMKLIVWFEPERVSSGTWLALNHPEWIFGGSGGGLLDLGNPDAWNWLVNHVDSLIVSEGIDLYRSDYNIDPLGYWRGSDASDRQGMAENKYVTGFLAYWDELRRRHPDMLIDSCASGGRRDDLETLRRSVPLLRSDDQFNSLSQQNHTFGLSSWVPFYGTGISGDEYAIRSSMCPSFGIGIDVRNEGNDYALMRRMYDDWRKVSDCMLADYYLLTPYSTGSNVWMAWQFNAPEKGEGMVQAFRRAQSPDASVCLKLHGLDLDSAYAVTDLDTGLSQQYTGRDLIRGLTISVQTVPCAKIFTYKKTHSFSD